MTYTYKWNGKHTKQTGAVMAQLHWASFLANRQRVNSLASVRVATSAASVYYTQLVKSLTHQIHTLAAS